MVTNNAINLKSSGIASYDAAGTFTALANPLTVANGGTGDSSLTAYAVLCGGTTSTGNIQSIAGVGTSGQILTSNGAGLLPTFQSGNGLGYVMFVEAGSGNPADGSTYFLGMTQAITAITASGNASTRFYLPKAGTISACYGTFTVSGTLATTETSTLSLRLNNTTDTTVSSSIVMSTADNTFNNSALSISVVAGDYIEFKLVNPSWGTNPTTVQASMSIYIS